jgi:hypothetical protein
MISKSTLFAALAAIAASAPAHADVTISTAKTQNMTCSKGVCSPTATDAVLDAGDLEKLLISGDVTVTTTGSGIQANSIDVEAGFKWLSKSTVTLDAHQAIAIDMKIFVAGGGGLSIVTSGRGGTLSFGPRGRAVFLRSGVLDINRSSYTLVGDIETLASDIAQNPGGAYALADDYDASKDGTYSTSPIPTTFTGIFEGLGNTISNVSIKDTSDYSVGFFNVIAGKVASLRLQNLQINASNALYVGGLVAGTGGVLRGDSVSGSITAVDGGDIGGLAGQNSCGLIDDSSTAVNVSISSTTGKGRTGVGGLVGFDDACEYGEPGSISNSRATGSITAQSRAWAGGLIGTLWGGSVSTSFATGNVNCVKGCHGGGLVGHMSTVDFAPSVANSYATGNVVGGETSEIGGLIGYLDAPDDHWLLVDGSYSTGSGSAGTKSFVGGLIGFDQSYVVAHCYWDTDTSGTDEGTGTGNVSGITGLTTEQFVSRLPKGFKHAIWAEQKGTNGGFPYLIANPPPK